MNNTAPRWRRVGDGRGQDRMWVDDAGGMVLAHRWRTGDHGRRVYVWFFRACLTINGQRRDLTRLRGGIPSEDFSDLRSAQAAVAAARAAASSTSGSDLGAQQ